MNAYKRMFDLLFSALGLVLLWPLIGIVALLIKLQDGGPIFYRQMRIGFRGTPFQIWKFRTMVVEADRTGNFLTIGQDQRITPLGAILRKSKIDEIPQLFNVLVG